MSAAAVVVIVTRPRPNQQSEQFSYETVADSSMSVADVLRQLADELDAGPTLPPVE